MPFVLTVLELVFIGLFDLDKKYDDIMNDLKEGKIAGKKTKDAKN